MTLLKSASESTTAFIKRIQAQGMGGSSVLVGGFIGSASIAGEIIEKGIRGEHLNIWYGIKFLFFFTMASIQSYNLWKTDPKSHIAGLPFPYDAPESHPK